MSRAYSFLLDFLGFFWVFFQFSKFMANLQALETILRLQILTQLDQFFLHITRLVLSFVKVLGKAKEEEKNKLQWLPFFLFLFEMKILLFGFSLIQNITSFKLTPLSQWGDYPQNKQNQRHNNPQKGLFKLLKKEKQLQSTSMAFYSLDAFWPHSLLKCLITFLLVQNHFFPRKPIILVSQHTQHLNT